MTFEDKIHEPRFTTKQASEVTGVNWETMRGWIKRKIILADPQDDVRAVKAQGSPYLLSFASIMQIAITARLDELGIPPSRGGTIALKFTHMGEAKAEWVGEPESSIYPGHRRPGRLFGDNRYTFLAAYAGEQFGYVFGAVGMKDESFFQKLFFPAGIQTNRAQVAAVLWIDPIFRDLKYRLDTGENA